MKHVDSLFCIEIEFSGIIVFYDFDFESDFGSDDLNCQRFP